ncbi:helix-turn-helix domain-containing protein [Vibrio vulnificus]
MDSNANFSTLAIMILKEIRMDRHIHQGVIADRIGKTPSAWAKIENGQSSLTFDVMVGACSALQVHPSVVLSLIDKLVPMFGPNRFYFQVGMLNHEEDDLLRLTQSYFNSKGYEVLRTRVFDRVSIESLSTNNPFGFTSTPTIVRYCCEQEFKNWVDEGALGEYPKEQSNWF